jgi:hypothetical protein
MIRADKWPQPILQVVSLKPGETRMIDLAFPGGDFPLRHPPSRQYLYAERIPPLDAGEKPEPMHPDDTGACPLGDGVTLVWERERHGISFRAAPDAKPGSVEVRVSYFLFTAGTGELFTGFRVVIQGE